MSYPDQKMQLRPYQEQAIEQTLECWAQYDRLLGVAAVGAGKTIIAAHVI
jgi:superfamily II DNA or RNA helicase